MKESSIGPSTGPLSCRLRRLNGPTKSYLSFYSFQEVGTAGFAVKAPRGRYTLSCAARRCEAPASSMT